MQTWRPISNHAVQALEKHRKTGEALKCKQCVQEAEAKERREAADAAAARLRSESSSLPPQQPGGAGPEKEEGDIAPRECASCKVALDRIQKFLKADEMEQPPLTPAGPPAVKIDGGKFAWGKDGDVLLQDINLEGICCWLTQRLFCWKCDH